MLLHSRHTMCEYASGSFGTKVGHHCERRMKPGFTLHRVPDNRLYDDVRYGELTAGDGKSDLRGAQSQKAEQVFGIRADVHYEMDKTPIGCFRKFARSGVRFPS